MSEQQEQTIQSLLHALRETHRALDKAWSRISTLENDLAKERAYTAHLEGKIIIQSDEIADQKDRIDLLEDQKAELQNLASSSK